MKSIILTNTGAFILAIASNCCFLGSPFCYGSRNETPPALYAQTNQNREPVITKQTAGETPPIAKKPRPRVNFVKVANFYLRSDELVFGKLVSEDKNKITIEQLDESKIVVSTYSKREIDIRTLVTKNVPEANYYLELAEYFSGRTWDFRDDPDDFIQAIRCCEKAKQSVVETRGQDSEKIDEINHKIKQLEADRLVWAREVESRARLKKLEFEAEIAKRLKKLEDKVSANTQQVNESTANIKDYCQKLEKSIFGMNKDLSQRLQIVEERVRTNRRLIDDIAYTRYYYHYHRYYSPRLYYPYDRSGGNP